MTTGLPAAAADAAAEGLGALKLGSSAPAEDAAGTGPRKGADAEPRGGAQEVSTGGDHTAGTAQTEAGLQADASDPALAPVTPPVEALDGRDQAAAGAGVGADGSAEAPALSHARGDRRVFVGGIPYASTEAELGKFLSDTYGPVSEVKFIYDNSSMKFKGYGFVLFRDATAAQAARDGGFVPFAGRTLNISKAVRSAGGSGAGGSGGPGSQAGPHGKGGGYNDGDGRRVALEGLPPDATEAGLRELTAQFGQVRHVRMFVQHATGAARGGAHIIYRSGAAASACKAALARGALSYGGRTLTLAPHTYARGYGGMYGMHGGAYPYTGYGAHPMAMAPMGYTREGLFVGPGMAMAANMPAISAAHAAALPYGGVAGSHYGMVWPHVPGAEMYAHQGAAQAQAMAQLEAMSAMGGVAGAQAAQAAQAMQAAQAQVQAAQAQVVQAAHAVQAAQAVQPAGDAGAADGAEAQLHAVAGDASATHPIPIAVAPIPTAPAADTQALPPSPTEWKGSAAAAAAAASAASGDGRVEASAPSA